MWVCCKWLIMANCGLGQVVLESLRMASIISFPFREAIADVEYKGKKNIYYICKTWTLFKIGLFLGQKLHANLVTIIMSSGAKNYTTKVKTLVLKFVVPSK